jgi:hypothetical protein
VACQRKLWGECARLGAHYALLFALFPARVLLPAVFLSGLLTATIVTVSHVTEDLYFDGPHKVGVWGVGLVCLRGRWQARQTLRPPFLLLPLRVGQWLDRHRHTHTRTRQSRALSVSLFYFGPQSSIFSARSYFILLTFLSALFTWFCWCFFARAQKTLVVYP